MTTTIVRRCADFAYLCDAIYPTCCMDICLLGKFPLALIYGRVATRPLRAAALRLAGCILGKFPLALSNGDTWASPGALRLPSPPVDAFGVLQLSI